jgi:hypothetical protein
MALEQLKRELEHFGEQNDGAQHSRGSKMLNITRDTGELLAVLVQDFCSFLENRLENKLPGTGQS